MSVLVEAKCVEKIEESYDIYLRHYDAV